MLCYRDMAFCSAYGSACRNDGCGRAATPAVEAAAKRWWGGDDAPMALSDLSPRCAKIIRATPQESTNG